MLRLMACLILLYLSILSPVLCIGGGGGVLQLHRVLPSPRTLSGPHYEAAVAHDSARHGRIMNFSKTGVPHFPVGGSFHNGLYYITVELGTPPVDYHVIFDTGSEIPWVGCISCVGCPRSTGFQFELKLFNISASTTARAAHCRRENDDQCHYTLSYGDGTSTSGVFVSDVLHFDAIASHTVPFRFGCSTAESGNIAMLDMAVDGIFGFSQGSFSVISQLSEQNFVPRVFSHCLREDGGGSLVLGEVLHGGMAYSPLLPSKQFYKLDLLSMSLNGRLLNINPTTAIVDSGTTFAYLVAGAYDPFVNVVTALIPRSFNITNKNGRDCFEGPLSMIHMFPVVSLNFASGAQMHLEPKNYINQLEENLLCIALQRHEGLMILGGQIKIFAVQNVNKENVDIINFFYKYFADIILKDKIIVYDLEHKRLGWADYNCSLAVDVAPSYGGSSTIEMHMKIYVVIFCSFIFSYYLQY